VDRPAPERHAASFIARSLPPSWTFGRGPGTTAFHAWLPKAPRRHGFRFRESHHWPGTTSMGAELPGRFQPRLAETGMTALERAGPGTCRSFRLDLSAGFGRVEVWGGNFRSNILVAAPFRLAVPYWFGHDPVSTPRSSNRTRRFPASGSRTNHHAFTHDTSRPSWVRRTSPKCP
jgi:hypothetical protein